MAIESVDLAAPTGKCGVDTVDTDKVIQYVKLMSGADGSATAVAAGSGTEANGVRTTPGTVEMTTLTGTDEASGDNEVVGTPGANHRLVVAAFSLQNETTTAQTLILRSAATTNGWRARCQNRGDGMARVFAPGREWRLNTNEALNVNLSASKSVGWSVMYWTEDV